MDTAPLDDLRRADLAVPAAAAITVAAIFLLLSLPTLLADPGRWRANLFSYEGGWLVLCTVLGAAAGGAVFAPHFGLPGLRGALRSAGAYLAAFFVGGFVGGTLAFPFYGSMIGPVVGAVLVEVSFESARVALWILLAHLAIAGAMHLAGRYRRRLLAMPPAPALRPLLFWIAAALLCKAFARFWFGPMGH